MAAMHDLIQPIGDPHLRGHLAAEWTVASQDKKFGLVFERLLRDLTQRFSRGFGEANLWSLTLVLRLVRNSS